MTELRPARKKVPTKVLLHAALRQLGFEPHEVEADHDPALARRRLNPEGTDYDPPQHDPKHIIWRPIADHRRKTFGTPATTLGSDIHEIAKTRRLTKQQQVFVDRLLAKSEGREMPKSKWPKRRFGR